VHLSNLSLGCNLLVLDAPLALLGSANLAEGHALVVLCVDVGEADLGHKLLALPGLVDDAVQLVDLLEREALGLVDHEVDKGDAYEAEAAPDEEDLALEVGVLDIDHVGGCEGNGPVEEPVAGSGHGETLGAGLEGEQLAGDDPSDGTPRRGEEEDVDAHEGDGGALSSEIGGTGDRTCDGDDELANTHADGTEKKQVAASKALNHVQTREGGDNVDTVGDDLDDEGVLEASVLEVRCSVVDCNTLDGKCDEGMGSENLQMKLTPVSC
jgi:hypothetical protein